MPRQPQILILGGGPAGVGAAYRLASLGCAKVTLVEQAPIYGGLAGSFVYEGLHLDYGSHRLHRTTPEPIFADLQRLLGDDLRKQKRRGRIRLNGRWLKFPLEPIDLLVHLAPRVSSSIAGDILQNSIQLRRSRPDSFASAIQQQLGTTVLEQFYRPYARKLWGCEPEALSPALAQRRVSANNATRLLARILNFTQSSTFYYPRQGFGQLTEAYRMAAQQHGATMLPGHRLTAVYRNDATRRWMACVSLADGGERELEADHLWSTLPLSLMAELLDPQPPQEVLDAGRSLSYRAMVLVYLDLPVDRFSHTQVHYFPEPDVHMSRLSEPKSYFGHEEPRGRTVLCAELPCTLGDEIWAMNDHELGALVMADMQRADLPLPAPPSQVFTRRLSRVYPIYRQGYESALSQLDAWMESLPNVISFGRLGAFAHDNTHHALAMAYAAADCFQSGRFDRQAWQRHRKAFESHVVED